MREARKDVIPDQSQILSGSCTKTVLFVYKLLHHLALKLYITVGLVTNPFH